MSFRGARRNSCLSTTFSLLEFPGFNSLSYVYSARTCIFTFLVIAMGAMEEIWEDLLDESMFSLFAIHSNLEDHTLAYALNEACGLKLKRTSKGLEFDHEVSFVVFDWKDQRNYRDWTLFRNPGWETAASPSGGLFADEPARNRRYLIPEKREVDYFLKMDGEEQDIRILPALLSTPRVTTAYRLQASELRSRHNLVMF